MTKEIQEAVCKMLLLRRQVAICENFSHHIGEMDIASLSQSGLIHEFEVKISRSDFLADERKRKFKFYHEVRESGYCPNYFYYVCPTGLINKNEIPVWAGLYYYQNGELDYVKSAKRLHNQSVLNPEKVVRKMLRLNVERKYLGNSYMTFKNKEIQRRYDEIGSTFKSELK